MKDTIHTREFSINDYDAAVELWKRVEGLEIAEGDDKESVVRFLTRNPGLSRVATDGSGIVGVSLCGHDGRRGHIYHLAVDPRYQGVGLGMRLVQECFSGLRDAGWGNRVNHTWRHMSLGAGTLTGSQTSGRVEGASTESHTAEGSAAG